MGEQSNAPGGVGTGEVGRRVDEIHAMLKELRATQHAIRRKTRTGLVLVLLVAGGFAVAGYMAVRDNFAPDKVQAAAEARMQLLIPKLEPALTATLKEVTPYYMTMGRDRFQKLGPKLDAAVQAEADKLGKDLEKQMNMQLDGFIAKLSSRAAAQLTANFPGVVADGGARAIAKISQLLLDQGNLFHEKTMAVYLEKVNQVNSALARFPVADVRQKDLDSLNRQLLHDLLMLADQEMTGGGNVPLVVDTGAGK